MGVAAALGMGRKSRSNHPLAALRDMLGTTQRRFADAVDMSPHYLAQVETGEPVSETLAGRIGMAFGALVPLGRLRDMRDRTLRAAPKGGPFTYDPARPALTQKHLDEWQRRVDVGIRFSKWPPERGWETALAMLGAIGDALRGASIEGASCAFTVKGADVDELRTEVIAALARAPELGALAPLKDDGGQVRGLSVGSVDKGGPVVQITLARRGQPGWASLQKNLRSYVMHQSGFMPFVMTEFSAGAKRSGVRGASKGDAKGA